MYAKRARLPIRTVLRTQGLLTEVARCLQGRTNPLACSVRTASTRTWKSPLAEVARCLQGGIGGASHARRGALRLQERSRPLPDDPPGPPRTKTHRIRDAFDDRDGKSGLTNADWAPGKRLTVHFTRSASSAGAASGTGTALGIDFVSLSSKASRNLALSVHGMDVGVGKPRRARPPPEGGERRPGA